MYTAVPRDHRVFEIGHAAGIWQLLNIIDLVRMYAYVDICGSQITQVGFKSPNTGVGSKQAGSSVKGVPKAQTSTRPHRRDFMREQPPALSLFATSKRSKTGCLAKVIWPKLAWLHVGICSSTGLKSSDVCLFVNDKRPSSSWPAPACRTAMESRRVSLLSTAKAICQTDDAPSSSLHVPRVCLTDACKESQFAACSKQM